jgi:hypothetical protein
MMSRRFAIVTFAIVVKHALQGLGVWAIDERQRHFRWHSMRIRRYIV